MLGLMQDWPLTMDKVIDHARRLHGRREIVTRTPEGGLERTTYLEVHDRAKRVSGQLKSWGIDEGDRVATLAWNTARHLECWYGIMGIGAVCHTLNPRLHPAQLAWIINHAGDRVIFADTAFAPLLCQVIGDCPTVEHVVFLADDGHLPAVKPDGAHGYESLLAAQGADCAWGGFDERAACGLCYTSGATGDPKGVLYSHRSNFLHCMLAMQADTLGISNRDTVLPIVPMFHANAWGVAFAAPAAGAKLVLPGPKLDGSSIYQLLEEEDVTFSAAVPTVWAGLLQHMQTRGLRLTTLERVVIGGAACPEALIRGFHHLDVEVVHAWGMTELSPIGTIGHPPPELARQPFEKQLPTRLKQGRAPLTVEMRLVDGAGEPVAHDGTTPGRLMVRGPAIAGGYFRSDAEPLDENGFFDTGDIATIDPDGFMQVTDRAKDVIKSGGEWISSIEIETLAAAHPAVEMAAVIGIPHPVWDERPLLLVKPKPGRPPTRTEILAFLEGKVARWQTPDDVCFLDAIPLGPTGKVDKKALREQFRDHRAPASGAPKCRA